MPRGKRISLQMREIICRNIVDNNFTVEQIFAALFDNDPAQRTVVGTFLIPCVV